MKTERRRRAPRLLSSSPLPAGLVGDLLRVLQEQRAFRVDQLAQLDAAPVAASDPARREVAAALREAAQLVLIEIDAALHRIEHGSFGRCRRCGEVMSLERLTALPMSTWCGSCHHQQDLAAGRTSRSPVRRRITRRE